MSGEAPLEARDPSERRRKRRERAESLR